jgi:hypothetical protein
MEVQLEVAGRVEGVDGVLGEPHALIKLADGQQSGVAGELARRKLYHE